MNIKYYSNLENIETTTNVKGFIHFNNLNYIVDEESISLETILNRLTTQPLGVYRLNNWLIFVSNGFPYKIEVKKVKQYVNENIFRLED